MPPLNLPEGSIRAILALSITAVALLILGMYGSIPSGLEGIWGTVLGYYFGKLKTP